jgi:hypothetical protein
MVSFDEAAAMLDEIAEEIPQEFYERLNGGVNFLPRSRRCPESRKNRPLYILGEYVTCPAMGRYINIYFGSFLNVFPDASHGKMREELKRTLVHEFTHHVETLAGERGLVIRDEIEKEHYFEGDNYE